MATVRSLRSDVFPPGTTVSVRPHGSKRDGQAPCGAEIASGTVDSAGVIEITSGSVPSYTRVVLYALVGGEHRYLNVRSTLDIFDNGTATATGDTTSGSAALSNVTVSAGTLQAGMRVTGPGIRPGTTLFSGSGGSWTMSATATATATGVQLKADGANVWSARLRRRRGAVNTA